MVKNIEIFDFQTKIVSYLPEFVNLVSKTLNLNANETFIDLGCGNGQIASKLFEKICFFSPVICINFKAKENIKYCDSIRFVTYISQIDSFSEFNFSYDKILIKSAIKHINDFAKFSSNIWKQMTTGGNMLFIENKYDIENSSLKNIDNIINTLNTCNYEIQHSIHRINLSMPEAIFNYYKQGNYTSIIEFLNENIIENMVIGETDNIQHSEELYFIKAQKR